MSIRAQTLSRRRFIELGTFAALACLVPGSALAHRRLQARRDPERSLNLYNVHSGEQVRVVYWVEGAYVPDALREIDGLLRDHRANATRAIDVRLLDTLHELGRTVQARHPFHVISGYRTPQTNAWLRRHRRGVARFSLHTRGKAVDIHLPGCELRTLRRAAINLRRGGVGYYPRSSFLHVDVGRVRDW
jgi:uncharacterized protein YcbK (DUF882 family)